jgi:hypothetical protein
MQVHLIKIDICTMSDEQVHHNGILGLASI